MQHLCNTYDYHSAIASGHFVPTTFQHRDISVPRSRHLGHLVWTFWHWCQWPDTSTYGIMLPRQCTSDELTGEAY